jgi:hypothetical protein
MSRAKVLAVAPVTRGLGYVVFAAPKEPLDWGVKETRSSDKNAVAIQKIAVMLDKHKPSVLVIEDHSHLRCTRSLRVRTLLRDIGELGASSGVRVVRYGGRDVRAMFRASGRSKDAMAGAIAERVPELKGRLPKKRKLWESDRHGMAIFEAAALALKHYASATEIDWLSEESVGAGLQ